MLEQTPDVFLEDDNDGDQNYGEESLHQGRDQSELEKLDQHIYDAGDDDAYKHEDRLGLFEPEEENIKQDGYYRDIDDVYGRDIFQQVRHR